MRGNQTSGIFLEAGLARKGPPAASAESVHARMLHCSGPESTVQPMNRRREGGGGSNEQDQDLAHFMSHPRLIAVFRIPVNLPRGESKMRIRRIPGSPTPPCFVRSHKSVRLSFMLLIDEAWRARTPYMEDARPTRGIRKRLTCRN